MTTSAAAARRHAWLELLQQSGPFLTVPVADRMWPTGLPTVPAPVRALLRHEVTRLLDTGGAGRHQLGRRLLCDALGWGDALVQGTDLPAALTHVVPEHNLLLRPDFGFRAELEEPDPPLEETTADDDGESEPAAATGDNSWRILGMWVPWGSHPLGRSVQAGWAASPVERLAALLRATDVPIGLVSDGRWWAVVWAPRGKPVGAAVWDAALWSEEPETLQALIALLGRRRFFDAPQNRLPALLEESAQAQEEVTTALGAQVRAAVEMLIARLDELDREASGTLLDGVSDDDLYAAVVTVMMRIVFLLFAEERRLLPSDDARYDRGYSIGRLVEQLEQRAAVAGEQTLEHRTGAWHRILAVSRALHRGVEHEDLRLPPYGGGLFDPDRYPWLEGRDDEPPPPVDDLTVLRMLEAVQYVRLHGERRRLTFRALDVEQIGYVYEGLLELEVRTATEPMLGLRQHGPKGRSLLSLSEALTAVGGLESWTATTYIGEKQLKPAGRSTAARRLAAVVPPTVMIGMRKVLGPETAARLQPLATLVRRDDLDRPLLTPTGGRYVASSTRRAATGAHYTPRSLAEEIVRHALEPLAYRPGPLETLDQALWQLRPSTDLLALRVADIAMGSGAFLVAACRYLGDRVVEAWEAEGDAEAARALARRTAQTADAEVEGILLRARRLVAEHCLYGVDINPLAVEMAKLSLWLVTMDRERPFGFLDDRLVAGDSLLGIASLEQLEALHLDPAAGRRLRRGTLDYTAGWREMLARAADTRRRITATPVVTVRDVERKTDLLHDAQEATEPLRAVADALTGAGMTAATHPPGRRDGVFVQLETAVWAYEAGDASGLLRQAAALQAGLPEGKEPRRPLHWPLVFPEVFADAVVPGFDAIVGNPPFLGGQKVSGSLGTVYGTNLQVWDGAGVTGSCDLGARFFLRADWLLGTRGQLGYVITNTALEGATLKVGLLQLQERGWTLRRGVSTHPWPSASANLSIVELWTSKPKIDAFPVLDGEPVPNLGVDLQPYLRETGRPERLSENDDIVFQGSIVLGLGFVVDPDHAQQMIEEDASYRNVLFPYVTGADLNKRPNSSASRWVIDFHDWPMERAERYHPDLLEQVRRLVKPQRDKNTRTTRRDQWWLYGERASGLYAAIKDLDQVLAICLVGNVLLPVRVPNGQVFAHKCGVFALEEFSSLAVLSSSVHQIWVIRYTSTFGTGINYSPSDVFLTLPRPVPTRQLHKLGETLDNERRELMLERALGLTKLYNQVHDPAVTDPAIRRLRELHEQIDLAVLAAYGWSDLDPQVGHHPTKIGIRWTVSPEARFELLDRLLVENHRRAAAQT